MAKPALNNQPIDVRLKLAALWVAAMLLYLYGDIIILYQPGAVQSMAEGNMGGWGPEVPANQAILLVIAMVMTPPTVMAVLSLLLPPAVNRWLNVVVGALYTAFVLVVMSQALSTYFFTFLSVVEAVLTALVVWFALRWPREPAPA